MQNRLVFRLELPSHSVNIGMVMPLGLQFVTTLVRRRRSRYIPSGQLLLTAVIVHSPLTGHQFVLHLVGSEI